MKGRTIRDADKIIVLKDGEVLLALNRLYAELHRKQYKDEPA